MYELSPEQVKLIDQTINRHNITFSHLREDLVDHVCCIVEEEMVEGKNFNDIFFRVLESIGINSFRKVQEQTILYINQTYQIMKNIMKISGIISTILVTFGALFKIQHWPFGGILLAVGYLVLLTAFLPSLMYVLYAENKAGKNRFVYISGFVGFFFLFLAFIFKIQHWPWANILMTAGVILICLLFLPSLLKKFIRESEDRVYVPIIYLGITCLFIYLFAFLFKMQQWPGASYLIIISLGLIALVLLPWYGILKLKSKAMFESSFIFITLALSWFVLTAALINYNVSVDLRPQYSKTVRSYESLNNYLKANVDKHYYEILSSGLVKNTNSLPRINKLHSEAEALIGNLMNEENEILSQFHSKEKEPKASDDRNARLEFVIENGLDIMRGLSVSSSIQAFDSITQLQFEAFLTSSTSFFPENKMEVERIRTFLSPGIRINKNNEKSDVYFTDISTVTQFVSSLIYLQNAVYGAEDIVFSKYLNARAPAEAKLNKTDKMK